MSILTYEQTARAERLIFAMTHPKAFARHEKLREKLRRKRSEAAKKGWKTRRKNRYAHLSPWARRHWAAVNGWKTRRKNQRKRTATK